jgi:hypothetical protein
MATQDQHGGAAALYERGVRLQRITGKHYFGSADPFPGEEVMATALAALSVRHLSALDYYPAKFDDGRLVVFLAYVDIRVAG